MLESNRTSKKKSVEPVKSKTRSSDGILFTSRTRNTGIQFERSPASFFGWTNVTYKSRGFSYRRESEISLNRRRSSRSRRSQFAF
ncbi:MAG: hypothetical protein AAF497_19365 [Planctomycetota bacterium]